MTTSPNGVVLRFGPLHGEDMAVLGEEDSVGAIVEDVCRMWLRLKVCVMVW
jgi:hypothetical protein